jgi:hypothetical protein
MHAAIRQVPEDVPQLTGQPLVPQALNPPMREPTIRTFVVAVLDEGHRSINRTREMVTDDVNRGREHGGGHY